MTLRPALALLAGLLAADAAHAAPVLKANVVVSADVVTVGDMFDDAGLASEQALFRAPRPGTTGQVSLADIRAAMARAGLMVFGENGLTTVQVSRAATPVDEDLLGALIEQDLTARGIVTKGMSADTLFAKPIAPVNAEAVAQPAHIVSLRYLPGTGAFSARFAIAGMDQPLDVSGTIELMIEAPHLVSGLPAGTVLGPEDVEMRPVPLRYAESSGVAGLDDIVGMALVRQSREGLMLRPADVTTPLLIAKNDLVTIYYRKGPMTLTVKGQAITGAADGAPLQVLNLMSKRVISARALAAGAVEVTADAVNLAGI